MRRLASVKWAVAIAAGVMLVGLGVIRWHNVSSPVHTYNASTLQPVSQKISIPVPTLRQIQFIQMTAGMPGAKPSPKIDPSTDVGKATILKLLNDLQSAKAIGYERPHPMPSITPPDLLIQLKDGTFLEISLPIDSTTHRYPGRTVYSMHVAKGYVDVPVQGNRQLRVYAPKLSAWIDGGWKTDLT